MRSLLRIITLLFTLSCLLSTVSAPAQDLPKRSARTRISGGRMPHLDTMRRRADSLHTARALDSLRRAQTIDTAAIDSLLRRMALITGEPADTARLAQVRQAADSLANLPADSLAGSPADSLISGIKADTLLSAADSLRALKADSTVLSRRERRRGKLFSDSMSISKVCWTAAVLPGYGQIYNKQYWKLPILYGTLGTSIALFAHESNVYKPLRREYNAMIANSTSRTPELDALQGRMIRSNTRRQVYLLTAIGSYLYFIGDAAVKYSTNDVSDVKKATTLACICPGAGQIYNRSYWKVPFVVGGFAAMAFCIDWNNRGFQRFRTAYHLRVDYDNKLKEWQDNGQQGERPVARDEFNGRYQASFLKNLKDNYRRNRDLCIIITAGLYILQVVDAHVDAHLKDYDISDDLSLNIEPAIACPYIPAAGGNRPVYGLNLVLNF